MSKNTNTSKPLLFISQPEWQTAESNMQSIFYIKLKEKQQELATIVELEESSEQPVINPRPEDQLGSNSEKAVQLMAEGNASKESELPVELVPEALDSDEPADEENKQQIILPIDQMRAEMKQMLDGDPASTGNQEAETETQAKPKADPQLVQMFLKDLIPKADEDLIKNIQEGNLDSLEKRLVTVDNDSQEKLATDEVDYKELKQTISRLARYPNVIKKPFCEASVNGKKIKFQVESKRGDIVRLRIGKKIQECNIVDLVDFKMI